MANADAWQSTYEKLAMRISDGRVDTSRPLKPLAQLTARRIFLSEHRRQQRFSALTDLQLHRFNLGDSVAPEEQVEGRRKRHLLRTVVTHLMTEGRLTETDLEVLDRRYVKDRNSEEVATAMRLSAQNVRQLCSRRGALLRTNLAGLEIEEEAAREL
jgi:DNA-directed RNA polymerase specialized sigma24 family protein